MMAMIDRRSGTFSLAGLAGLAGWAARNGAVAICTLSLAGCGAGVHYRPVSDLPLRIGPPYKVRGQTYVPAADPTYDVLGFASWYGNESGNQTANGERFRPEWVTGAHATLPLPSYVEVTSLRTGRTILVRINDRGPFAGGGRVIDLSRGAADQLGSRAIGLEPVRVRVVDPPESDRRRLRNGERAVARPTVGERTLENLRGQMRAAGLLPAG